MLGLLVPLSIPVFRPLVNLSFHVDITGVAVVGVGSLSRRRGMWCCHVSSSFFIDETCVAVTSNVARSLAPRMFHHCLMGGDPHC